MQTLECSICGSMQFHVVRPERSTFLQVRCGGCLTPLVDVSSVDETVCYRYAQRLRVAATPRQPVRRPQ